DLAGSVPSRACAIASRGENRPPGTRPAASRLAGRSERIMSERRDYVIGVFEDGLSARDAIQALKVAGFRGQDISVLMPDADAGREFATETGVATREGATTGALAGGVLGGLAGWLIGIGALAVPGVGALLAAGALGAALSGVAIGAGVGAIAGALVGI